MNCRFCGATDIGHGHWYSCDGRQGRRDGEAAPVLEARHSHPDTSHAAMAATDTARLDSAVDVLVGLHKTLGPMADFEQADVFAHAWTSPCCDHLYRQARTVARDQGRLRDTGETKVNPASGRKQIVWALNASGEKPALHFCETCGGLLRRRLTPDIERVREQQQ